MRTGMMEFHDSEQQFRQIVWGCVLFYAALAMVMNVIKIEKPEHQDFTQLSPRIANLLVPSQPPKPQEAAKAPDEAVPPPESASTETGKEVSSGETPSTVKNTERTPEQQTKHNRQVAMRSGLLKLLAKRDSVVDKNTEKLLHAGAALKGVTNRDHNSAMFGSLSGSGGADVGSGGIDQLIGELGGKIEGIHLGEKKVAAVENPLQLKDTQGKPVGRAYESIAAVVDGLKGWVRFIYNKALREDPNLKGVVTLEFTITKDGDVIDCRIASTTLNYPSIEEALVKRFKLLKFPASPKSGAVTVVYPITFSPSG